MARNITDLICKYEDTLIIWKYADFGRCFQQIALILPAYILLLFTSAFFCVKARFHQTRFGLVNRIWIVFLRMLAHLIIIGSQVGLIVEKFVSSERLEIFTTVVECLILMSWLLSLVAIIIWRNSQHSCAFGRDFDMLKIAWAVVFISCSFELYSAILYTAGYNSPLEEEPFSVYESINIYLRWISYLSVLLLQIPRSNHQNFPISTAINDAEEAGTSQGNLHESEAVSEHSFSVLSRGSFHWVTRLFSDAQHSAFPSIDDLPFNLPSSMNPITNHCKLKLALLHYSSPTFQPLLVQSDSHGNYDDIIQPLLGSSEEYQKKDKQRFPLLKSLNKAFGWSFWPLNLVKLVIAVLEISSPIVLNLLLQDLESGSESIASASIYLGLLVLIMILNSFIGSHLNYEISKLQITMRGSLISELYSKVMNVNMTGLASFSVGELTNFVSQDSDRISCHLVCFFEIWYMPLKLGIILYLLYKYIGLSFLAGIGFCILLIPLNQLIAKKLHGYNESLLEHRDKRLKLIHEVITNMKSIKFFSWEEKVVEKIAALRNIEIKELRKIANFDAICVYSWATAPCMITFLIMLTYSLLGNQVNASTVFTTLSLVSQVILPLNALPWVIMGFVQAWVSMKRIQKFLDVPEAAPQKSAICLPFEDHNVIEVDNCSFYWNTRENCCLVNLQFQVNKGELMIVMGKTGSGKSSLLLALSQELNIASGELRLKEWKEGSGLVLQDSWINSGSIRETILDGCVFDLYWYETVVSACALDKDIASFPEGDESQVGVNGSALSGGQKLRVSLARAVYKNKQVYLIDDIFSSLDVQVAQHILHNCINGVLASKTRVICTHNKSLCASANTLLILDEGAIQYIGPPSNSSIEQVDFLPSSSYKGDESGRVEKSDKLSNTYVEPRDYGAVDASVYKFYLFSAGYTMFCVVVLFLLLMQATDTASSVWLSIWAKQVAVTPGIRHFLINLSDDNSWNRSEAEEHDGFSLNDKVFDGLGLSSNSTFYLEVYGSIIAGNLICCLGRVVTFIPFQISATKILHDNMLNSIMRAPLHFFSATPIGVIINRFSSDVYTIDSDVPIEVNIFAGLSCHLLGLVVLTCYGLPYVLVSFIPLGVVYYLIQRYYRRAVREVKRLYSMSQSPLFSHFEETLCGVSYIHAFRCDSSVLNTGLKILKSYQRAQYCLIAATVWLRLRLELITTFVMAVVSAIILVEMRYEDIDASRLGLGLTFALSISQAMDYLITSFSDTEKSFVSAERVMQFTECLPQETECNEVVLLPRGWPHSGNITFSSVSVRYNNCTTKALHNVSFSVSAGEKVAVVGRTGAGKSTLLLALFKLVDLDSGNIVIDGVDIARVSNKLLRQSLAIIPQQPLIFTGTLRDNIDPFSLHPDSEVESAAREALLGDFLDSHSGLLTEVSLGTLSTGQSQLISLARALLTKCTVVCMDEATSNVDYERETGLHKLILDKFRSCTVLNIVHRIENVLDYDKVLVVSQGKVVEFGNPRELVADSTSHFHQLASSTGLTTSAGREAVPIPGPGPSVAESPPPSSLPSSSSSHRSSRLGSIRHSATGRGLQ